MVTKFRNKSSEDSRENNGVEKQLAISQIFYIKLHQLIILLRFLFTFCTSIANGLDHSAGFDWVVEEIIVMGGVLV